MALFGFFGGNKESGSSPRTEAVVGFNPNKVGKDATERRNIGIQESRRILAEARQKGDTEAVLAYLNSEVQKVQAAMDALRSENRGDSDEYNTFLDVRNKLNELIEGEKNPNIARRIGRFVREQVESGGRVVLDKIVSLPGGIKNAWEGLKKRISGEKSSEKATPKDTTDTMKVAVDRRIASLRAQVDAGRQMWDEEAGVLTKKPSENQAELQDEIQLLELFAAALASKNTESIAFFKKQLVDKGYSDPTESIFSKGAEVVQNMVSKAQETFRPTESQKEAKKKGAVQSQIDKKFHQLANYVKDLGYADAGGGGSQGEPLSDRQIVEMFNNADMGGGGEPDPAYAEAKKAAKGLVDAVGQYEKNAQGGDDHQQSELADAEHKIKMMEVPHLPQDGSRREQMMFRLAGYKDRGAVKLKELSTDPDARDAILLMAARQGINLLADGVIPVDLMPLFMGPGFKMGAELYKLNRDGDEGAKKGLKDKFNLRVNRDFFKSAEESSEQEVGRIRKLLNGMGFLVRSGVDVLMLVENLGYKMVTKPNIKAHNASEAAAALISGYEGNREQEGWQIDALQKAFDKLAALDNSPKNVERGIADMRVAAEALADIQLLGGIPKQFLDNAQNQYLPDWMRFNKGNKEVPVTDEVLLGKILEALYEGVQKLANTEQFNPNASPKAKENWDALLAMFGKTPEEGKYEKYQIKRAKRLRVGLILVDGIGIATKMFGVSILDRLLGNDEHIAHADRAETNNTEPVAVNEQRPPMSAYDVHSHAAQAMEPNTPPMPDTILGQNLTEAVRSGSPVSADGVLNLGHGEHVSTFGNVLDLNPNHPGTYRLLSELGSKTPWEHAHNQVGDLISQGRISPDLTSAATFADGRADFTNTLKFLMGNAGRTLTDDEVARAAQEFTNPDSPVYKLGHVGDSQYLEDAIKILNIQPLPEN